MKDTNDDSQTDFRYGHSEKSLPTMIVEGRQTQREDGSEAAHRLAALLERAQNDSHEDDEDTIADELRNSFDLQSASGIGDLAQLGELHYEIRDVLCEILEELVQRDNPLLGISSSSLEPLTQARFHQAFVGLLQNGRSGTATSLVRSLGFGENIAVVTTKLASVLSDEEPRRLLAHALRSELGEAILPPVQRLEALECLVCIDDVLNFVSWRQICNCIKLLESADFSPRYRERLLLASNRLNAKIATIEAGKT